MSGGTGGWERLRADADRLLGQGRVEEAVAAYQKLLAARADLPDSWYNLAYLQRSARRFEEALSSYGEAIRHRVERPEEVHLNRAAILSEHLERGAEAEAELREALRLNPRFVPAWLNLGNLYEDEGRAAEARGAYESALEVDPRNGRALARLSAIATFEGRPEATLPLLRKALAESGGDPETQAEISFAAGHALDALGRYDEAFAMFEAANRTARTAIPPQFRYVAEAHERLVDALIETFPLGVSAAAGTGAEPPVFICGLFRSGSTLAEQILARHSQVRAGGELEFIPALVHGTLQPYPRALGSASAETLEQLGSAYLEHLTQLFPDAARVTDKRPDNFLHIGLIKAMFPDAKIVHTVRSPLDNILSIYFVYFHDSVGYGFDLRDIVHWHGQYLRLMDHWKAVYPGDIHDLAYDDLVRDPRGSIGGLLEFLELPWEDDVLGESGVAGPVRTASVWQVRQPLHQRSSGRWRNYNRHVSDVTAALGLDTQKKG